MAAGISPRLGKRGSGLLALVLLAILAGTGSAAAQDCKRYFITGQSVSAPTHGLAYTRSKNMWSAQVRRRLGDAWSYWSEARRRSIICSGPAKRICKAKAMPCELELH